MEKRLLWTQTILSVYRYLERICGAIDKIILQNGLSSGNVYASNYLLNNAYAVSQRIIDLSQRKVTLINLKILVENTLSEISEKDALILIRRFFDGEKRKVIAQSSGVSVRTVYRKIESALTAFSSKMTKKGYGDIKLRDMLKGEAWIRDVYEKLSKKDDEDICISTKFLSKAVSV